MDFEDKILKIYRNRFNDEDLFYHLIERIEIHMDKLRNLKKDKNDKEKFLKEVADVYLLSKVLMRLEKVSQQTIEESSEYYLSKIKGLFD